MLRVDVQTGKDDDMLFVSSHSCFFFSFFFRYCYLFFLVFVNVVISCCTLDVIAISLGICGCFSFESSVKNCAVISFLSFEGCFHSFPLLCQRQFCYLNCRSKLYRQHCVQDSGDIFPSFLCTGTGWLGVKH